MRIDPVMQNHVLRLFSPLNQDAAGTLPSIGALSKALTAAAPSGKAQVSTTNIPPPVTKMFSTAAVNTWMRAVHSFLISTSLTQVSPIWASVAGYYSSHYSVRAIAHLLGFFQLFTVKRTVQLQFTAGHFVGTFRRKTGHEREHSVYWTVVKKDLHFAGDPFFTENSSSTDQSDVAHRDRANYADHLPHFPVFRPLDADEVRNRIAKISNIEVTSPPIPSVSKYPDVESVQVIAYHRLLRFRDLLDTILAGENRFWSVQRDPPWAREFMDFQVTDANARRVQFTLR